MNALLSKIFTENAIYLDDKKYELNSNIDIEEGKLLQHCIRSIKAKKTIEIGCAQGISSLFICEELKKDVHSHHTIIDPYQSTEWESVGVRNLQNCGFTKFELIEQFSELALPQLLMNNQVYDLAFIDGWHTFDHTLLDFFYLNRMLRVGGVIIIDDVGMPGVKKAVRYIMNYPSYEFFANSGAIKETFSRRLLSSSYKILSPATRIFGKKISSEVFQDSFLNSDTRLKINSSMVALVKVRDDERPWNWYKNF